MAVFSLSRHRAVIYLDMVLMVCPSPCGIRWLTFYIMDTTVRHSYQLSHGHTKHYYGISMYSDIEVKLSNIEATVWQP